MQPLDDSDEFVDGHGEFVEVTRSVVADSDGLNLLIDLGY